MSGFSLKKIFNLFLPKRNGALLPAPLPRSMSMWLERPISAYEEAARNDIFLTQLQVFDDIFRDLMESPTFRKLYDETPQIADYMIFCKELDNDTDGQFLAGDEIIELDYKPMDVDRYIQEWIPKAYSTLVHEYRHGWQSAALHYATAWTPYQRLVRGYVLEADAHAFQATVLWELKGRGKGVGWRHYKNNHPKIAKAFTDTIEEDPLALANGKAQNAVFHAWFESPKLINAYASSCVEEVDRIVGQRIDEVAERVINETGGRGRYGAARRARNHSGETKSAIEFIVKGEDIVSPDGEDIYFSGQRAVFWSSYMDQSSANFGRIEEAIERNLSDGSKEAVEIAHDVYMEFDMRVREAVARKREEAAKKGAARYNEEFSIS